EPRPLAPDPDAASVGRTRLFRTEDEVPVTSDGVGRPAGRLRELERDGLGILRLPTQAVAVQVDAPRRDLRRHVDPRRRGLDPRAPRRFVERRAEEDRDPPLASGREAGPDPPPP